MPISFFQVAQFIWSYLRRKPFWLSGILGFLIFQTASELAMPQLFGMLADNLSKFANNQAAGFPLIWWILGGIGATGLIFWILSKGKNIFWDWRWVPMLQKIQTDAFYRVQRFSTDWHVNSFAGATVRKITRGVWAANTFIDRFLFDFIPLSLLILGMIGVMLWRWRLIGLIVAGGTAIYLIFSIWIVRRFVVPRARAATRTDTKIGANVADAISCNATVKIFGRESAEDRRFTRTVEQWGRRHFRLWLAFNLTDIAQSFVMTAFKFALLVPVIIFWA
ncbi:MAG: ABC transporter ATP-binding protein, partial [Patescibacteria group bacterium]